MKWLKREAIENSEIKEMIKGLPREELEDDLFHLVKDMDDKEQKEFFGIVSKLKKKASGDVEHDIARIIESNHGTAVASQASQILNGEDIGELNGNAVDIIKKECQNYQDDGGILGEEAGDILERIEAYYKSTK